MDIEKQYQTLQRLRTVHLAQIEVIDKTLAELDKERMPPVPRQRRNLKDERMAEVQKAFTMGKWNKTRKTA